MNRHVTHLAAMPRTTVLELVERSLEIKRTPPGHRPLAGKAVALCFQNPSLRTRVSMEVATVRLGGHPVGLSLGGDTWVLETADGAVMDGRSQEHVREAVPVLARYCDVLALRSFPAGVSWEEDRREALLTAMRRLSPVPVINLESATEHPCQGLADLVTIRERMDPAGRTFLLTWAPHPRALPLAVPQSAAAAAAIGGMNVTILRPDGYDLDPDFMRQLADRCAGAGGRLEVTDDVEGAYRNADVVYAKAWSSLARYGQTPGRDPDLWTRWQVTEDKMRTTREAIFMHCLPVRRNVVVADGVLDGPWSVVVDQAENRLHSAMAVLEWVCRRE